MDETKPEDLRRFSNSELSTFRRCRRKWYFSAFRHLGLKREQAHGAARLGTRVHDALEVFYEQDLDAAMALLRANRDTDLLLHPDQDKAIIKDVELAERMVEGYAQWVEEEGEDQDFEVLGTEISVSVELQDPRVPDNVLLIGKLDQQVRKISTDQLLFLDHKTVMDFSRIRLLHLDTQIKHYMLLERLLAARGEIEQARTGGALYNMLRKVKRTGSAKPPFYMREIVLHTDDELRVYYEQVVREIIEILQVERELLAGANHRHVCYPNPTRDCGWDCDFFVVCGMVDNPLDDDEGLISTLYERGDYLARYSDKSPSDGAL